MKSCKRFVIAFLAVLACSCLPVVIVDPCFHYHRPLKGLSYQLFTELARYQNDGIMKHFDYDAVIAGSSMAATCKVSEADRIFGFRSIKVPYWGATFKEVNDGLNVALAQNGNLKTVIRCLDYNGLAADKDIMLEGYGQFPAYALPRYLYDRNPFNDVRYVFNGEFFLMSVYCVLRSLTAETGGGIDFDRYGSWMRGREFGREAVLQDRRQFCPFEGAAAVPSAQELQLLNGNIAQNVTALAREYPRCTFYCFFSPYSIAYWGELAERGRIEMQIALEKAAVELLLACPNIRLYSFNTEFDIVTDLSNYTDYYHYGDWINSLMLEYMQEGRGLLTKDNYRAYLAQEREFYRHFDYNSLFAE